MKTCDKCDKTELEAAKLGIGLYPQKLHSNEIVYNCYPSCDYEKPLEIRKKHRA